MSIISEQTQYWVALELEGVPFFKKIESTETGIQVINGNTFEFVVDHDKKTIRIIDLIGMTDEPEVEVPIDEFRIVFDARLR